MKFSVQPCEPADAHNLATTMMSAMYENWHWHYKWADPSLPEIIRGCAERLPQNLNTGRETKRHQKVIVETTGEVVGYARWLLPPELAEKNVWPEAQIAESSAEERQLFEKRFRENPTPKVKSEEMLEFRSALLVEADVRIMKDGPFLVLDYLTVKPTFQRQGIATMLVKSGLQTADIYHLKAYVMATPAGLKLYEDQGFEVAETACTDNSQFGGIEPFIHYFMVREPVHADR